MVLFKHKAYFQYYDHAAFDALTNGGSPCTVAGNLQVRGLRT
jgi:hypothetical protein